MFRSATITLILMSCLSGAAGVEIDASAVAALNEGNAAIERADADPNQNLVGNVRGQAPDAAFPR